MSDEETRGEPLHEVLVAFQKSLARAAQETAHAAQADPEFLQGRRSLYRIDSVEVRLQAALYPKLDPRGGTSDIQVAMGASPETCSELRFRVEATPLEEHEGPFLALAHEDPHGRGLPKHPLNLLLYDETGQGIPNHEVKILVFREGAEKIQKTLKFSTDLLGRLALVVDTQTNRIGQRHGEEKPIRLRSDAWYWIQARTTLDVGDQKLDLESPLVPLRPTKGG